MICEWHNGVTQSKFIVSGRNCSICPIFTVLNLVSFRPISGPTFQTFASRSWRVCTGMPIFASLSSSVAFFSSRWTDVHPYARIAVLRVRDMLPCPRYVHDMSKNEPSCACVFATGKTRWVFLLVRGPWWTSPHTVLALASSGQR